MKTKTVLTLILATMTLVAASLAPAQSGSEKPSESAGKEETKERVYDGGWWLAADAKERSGFLNGAADCLTSIAHAKWLTYSVPQLDEKITEYYRTRKDDSAMPVADVWRKLLSKSQPTNPTPGGEVWAGPHGFFDGEFWRQGSESENRGFLEGYLWCMRTCVNQPSATYSRSVSYYFDKIWEYIEAHPKTAYNEAIAGILWRLRDPAKPNRTTRAPKP